MDKKERVRFVLLDCLYLAIALLPVLGAMLLKILYTPASEGIQISGALIYFTVPFPLQDLIITESQVNSLVVLIAVFGLSLFMTHGLKTRNISIRQHVLEWAIEKVDGMVKGSMGEYFKSFSPFIIAILLISALSSFSSLLGLYPPTSDINIVAGWAILVFGIITYYKMKCGVLYYLKGFTEPIFVFTPMNILGELSTPISMAFRHYGNVLSGVVISVLIGACLESLSGLVLGWIPGVIGEFPLFRIGLPAVLSVYFDLFSGGLQAYIFAMLTMMNVTNAFPADDYFARQARKNQKKKNKNIINKQTEVI